MTTKTHRAPTDPETIVVRVPMTFRRFGGRKTIRYPAGIPAPASLAPLRPRGPLIKALARAFRWRKLIETGAYATIQEIADAENVNPSYVGRVMRLTLLAPEIVEAILDGRQHPGLTLDTLLKPFPAWWNSQRESFADR